MKAESSDIVNTSAPLTGGLYLNVVDCSWLLMDLEDVSLLLYPSLKCELTHVISLMVSPSERVLVVTDDVRSITPTKTLAKSESRYKSEEYFSSWPR